VSAGEKAKGRTLADVLRHRTLESKMTAGSNNRGGGLPSPHRTRRSRLGGFARLFAAARGGGVALPFALALVPVSFLTVAAVDFHRGQNIRSALQDALDAATLAVGRSSATTATDVQTVGYNALVANLRAYPDTQLTSSQFYLDGSRVVASAKVAMTPLISDVFTGGKLNVGAHSEVMRAGKKLEIALVHDKTGSMDGTKLSTLKTAASNFVDTLAAAAARSTDTDPVKIGLVPFSTTVKVGAEYNTAAWLDTGGVSPINDEIFTTATGVQHANRMTLFQQMNTAWAGCVETRQAPYDVQDDTPSSATPATLFTPYFAPDEPGTGKGTNGNYHNDYLKDVTTSTNWKVQQGYTGKYAATPKTSLDTWSNYHYGPNSGCELAPLMRLTTNFPTLKTAISAMTAIGDTNIPVGLFWGWNLLSPNGPFSTDSTAYNTPKVQKVVVLMTDGQNANANTGSNNASLYSGVGYIWQNRLGITSGSAAQRQAAIDARLTLLCANMKAKGIEIYTIRLEVNDNAYQVLQGCATKTDMFYDVAKASDLNSVFSAIAARIQNLRLSK
jgi:Flp pilus assembly protein TadG